MKILRVIASVDPRTGGPIEGLKLSANAMRDDGHETEVVCLDDPAAPYVASFPFPVHACGPGTRRYGYTPKLARWIAENGNQYDAAVVHGLWNHASIGGWQGLRKAGLPYVVFTHGMLDPWFRETYPLKHQLKQILWTLAQGKVLRDAHRVLFTSEEECRLARGVFRGHAYREQVVAYAAGEPPDEAAEQRAAFRALLPAVDDRRYLLFLSRIHPKKGCDLLMDAFVDMAGAHPDVDLVIAGPDQVGMKAELMAKAVSAGIAHRIHWPGMLSGKAKWGAFRGAEAFVLPSHQENFGIVVAEAMACGTPVLITNKVNIWREVLETGSGLVENDDRDGIVRLLNTFLGLSDGERQSLGHRARQGFERCFRADAAARDLLVALKAARGGVT